jgi:NitT/TauT family transport system substrate-binding protein
VRLPAALRPTRPPAQRRRHDGRHCRRLGALVVLALAAFIGGCAPAARPATPSSPTSPTAIQAASAPTAAATTPASSAAGLRKLRLGLSTTPAPALPESVLWLAKDLGFYEREGLDVELVEVEATPSVLTAMQTGGVDVGDVNAQDVIQLTSRKSMDLRAISSPASSNFFLIAARDTVSSLADLDKKPFGIARVGSLDHVLTAKVLEARGRDPAGPSFVAIGAPAVRAQALVAGRIDATTLSIATWATIAHEPGVKVLVNEHDYFAAAPLINKVDAVTSTVAKTKADELRRFTAAIMKSSRMFASDKNAWVQALRVRRPDLDERATADLWDQFGQAWTTNGQMNLAEYRKTSDFLYDTADFQGVPRIEVRDWADTQFVDAVLHDIGILGDLDVPDRST